jgi:hypothetical protein
LAGRAVASLIPVVSRRQGSSSKPLIAHPQRFDHLMRSHAIAVVPGQGIGGPRSNLRSQGRRTDSDTRAERRGQKTTPIDDRMCSSASG